MENRIEPFANLENLLDDNRLIYKFNQKAQPRSFSNIRANYLLSTVYGNNDIYIFLSKKEVSDKYFCRSFFPKENKDYRVGQSAYTLLFKEKITVSTGEKVELYTRFSTTRNN
jgi:hypothetical protein